MQLSPRLQQILEQQIGANADESRKAAFEQLTLACPPVDPNMVAHLRKVFGKNAPKAHNPLLTQLLTVQYGIDLVISYLDSRYNHQSATARKELGR